MRAVTGATRTVVSGEGAGQVPDGEDHLIVKVIRAGLDIARAPQVGLELRARNAIPHGRGLGSSAAAVVAGLLIARGLISEPEALNDQTVLDLATEWEGHPDNAAAAIFGGATLAWLDGEGRPHAEDLPIAAGLRITVLVPTAAVATRVARRVLPEQVPHGDAAFNLSRAALLVLALAGRRDLLMTATQDRLHQPYREQVLASSWALVSRLRSLGYPAVISGAGPTVLAFDALADGVRDEAAAQGWLVRELPIDQRGARIESATQSGGNGV